MLIFEVVQNTIAMSDFLDKFKLKEKDGVYHFHGYDYKTDSFVPMVLQIGWTVGHKYSAQEHEVLDVINGKAKLDDSNVLSGTDCRTQNLRRKRRS